MNKFFSQFSGLRIYLVFVTVVLAVYVYAMTTGYRFLSWNSTTHSREKEQTQRTHIRTFYHK